MGTHLQRANEDMQSQLVKLVDLIWHRDAKTERELKCVSVEAVK